MIKTVKLDLEGILGLVEFGRRIEHQEYTPVEKDSASYQALELLLKGRVQITPDGHLEPKPSISDERKSQAVQEIEQYKRRIYDGAVARFIAEEEKRLEYYFSRVGKYSGIPMRDYVVLPCLYIAVGHPEVSDKYIQFLEDKNNELREKQVSRMAEGGLTDSWVYSLLHERAFLHLEIAQIHIARGDGEKAEEEIRKVDKLGAIVHYLRSSPSNAFHSFRRNEHQWIDEPNPEFYDALIISSKEWNPKQKFYHDDLENYASKIRDKLNPVMEGYRERLERFKLDA